MSSSIIFQTPPYSCGPLGKLKLPTRLTKDKFEGVGVWTWSQSVSFHLKYALPVRCAPNRGAANAMCKDEEQPNSFCMPYVWCSTLHMSYVHQNVCSKAQLWKMILQTMIHLLQSISSCQAQPMHSHTGSSIRWKPKPAAEGVAIGHHSSMISSMVETQHLWARDIAWWPQTLVVPWHVESGLWRKATYYVKTSKGFLESPTKTRRRVFGTLPMGCCGVMSNRTVLMPWENANDSTHFNTN